MELLHGFVTASAVFLGGAILAGVAAGLADVEAIWRVRLITTEVLCLTAWLGLALVGHAHKVVPFIVWTRLRTAGRIPTGRPPLMFGDLYRDQPARIALALSVAGFATAVTGSLSATPLLFGTGVLAAGAAGAITLWNLATGPSKALRDRAS